MSMKDRTAERQAAKELEADIQAINDEEMLCLMQGDARTVAQSLSAMGWRKQAAE